MSNKVVLFGAIAIAVVVVSFAGWFYWKAIDYSAKTKHETELWTVIQDSKGDILAVETTDSVVWNTLVELGQNQTEMWIGGIVEEYTNYWGFRFMPDTIVVAEITIEGAQSNIQGVSEDLEYWINIWAKETYVLSRVIEIHE